MTDTSTVKPAVEGRGLIQSFGERRVLDGVDLALRGGEVLAPCGRRPAALMPWTGAFGSLRASACRLFGRP